MKKQQYQFMVVHPLFGRETVKAEDELEAVMLAAQLWDERWTTLYKDCTVTRGRRVDETQCPRCEKVFPRQGGKRYCNACQREMAGIKADAPVFRRPDRRIAHGDR